LYVCNAINQTFNNEKTIRKSRGSNLCHINFRLRILKFCWLVLYYVNGI